MKKIKPLGILYYKNEVVNHRCLLKIFLNPVLSMFGITIASYFEKTKFLHYVFVRCKPQLNLIKNFDSNFFTCNDYDRIEKKRIII